MTTRIILDTDIGTDVDDCLALALILGSPELRLEGVTCVYGDTLLRARMVLKLLHLRGISHVPVMVGARKPLLGLRPVYWEGHEGEGLLTEADESLLPSPEFAPDYIARTVMENPGQIHLVCIGPLTNAALAFLRQPEMARALAGLTLMGGVIRGLHDLDLPFAEHNILCDPDAAHIVFSSGAPITFIPLDVTVQTRITPEGVRRIHSRATAYHSAVARQIELYPAFQRRGWTYTHDPLAVASLIQPEFLTYRHVHVDVELKGHKALGMTLVHGAAGNDSNIRAAVGVDAPRFEEWLVSRLAG